VRVKIPQSTNKARLRCDGGHTRNVRSGNNRSVTATALKRLAERYDASATDPPLAARVRVVSGEEAHDVLVDPEGARVVEANGHRHDAIISGSPEAWRRAAESPGGGLDQLRRGGLRMRQNLHVAVGFLAGTSSDRSPYRLRLHEYETPFGPISAAEAGHGPPLLAIHGLGGTKASFLPTIGALADAFRVIAVDLPGFGDSVKPLRAPFDAPYFARAMSAVLDAAGLERAHVVGNSMGGRIGIEMALTEGERVDRLVLLSPAMTGIGSRLSSGRRSRTTGAQRRGRSHAEPFIRRLVPRDGWAAAGMDEFLRAYSTARGRHAFNAVARNIYLDEPHGDEGLWSRLAGMTHESLFVWGRKDTLVPIGFMKHVEKAFPAARHVELYCGHVPQVERPRETHAAMRKFLTA
jgi:pimeloyl-ACP methyl ester carboxylesterase